MNQELSDQTFESRMQNILGVLCYVDYKEDSKVDVIVFHQHLGLQNYVRVMAQALTYNQFSIIIPNLFGEAEDNGSDEEEDNANFLKKLNQDKIALIALSIIDYVAQRGNSLVLVGFSLGSAIGMKILEYTNKIDLAFMFYGLPPLKSVKPANISTQLTIFSGLADKVDHLSDKKTLSKAKQVYADWDNIKFIDLQGGKHGFMNPASDHYDESLFQKCCKQFHKQVQTMSIEQNNSQVKISGGMMASGQNMGPKSGRKTIKQQNEQETNIKGTKKGGQKEKKEEDSGCQIF